MFKRLSESSSMLIINKVPTEKTLERKRKKGEECRDRKEVLNEMFKAVSNAIGSKFKYELFLENDESEEGEENNKKKYNLVKIFTFFSSNLVNSEKVRTWDEIVTFYKTKIEDQFFFRFQNGLKLDLENRLDKVEYDIADYKYPFLSASLAFNKPLVDKMIQNISFDLRIIEFVSKFECSLTQEKYEELTKNTVIQTRIVKLVLPALLPGLGHLALLYEPWFRFRNIEENLNNLGSKRTDLKQQLVKCKGKIDEQKKLVEEQKAKIIRLENALVNPNQITS